MPPGAGWSSVAKLEYLGPAESGRARTGHCAEPALASVTKPDQPLEVHVPRASRAEAHEPGQGTRGPYGGRFEPRRTEGTHVKGDLVASLVHAGEALAAPLGGASWIFNTQVQGAGVTQLYDAPSEGGTRT